MTTTNSMELMKLGKEESKKALATLKTMDITSRKPQAVIAGVAGVGALVVVGPIIATLVTGLSAVALAGAGVLAGTYGFQKFKAQAPAKRAEWQQEAMVARVENTRKMNIYHLNNSILERTTRSIAAYKGVVGVAGLVKSYEMKREKVEAGGTIANALDKKIITFTELHKKLLQGYTKGLEANKEFETTVNESREMEKITNMAKEVTQFISAGQGTTMEDIMDTEALDAIDEAYNLTMAEIETSISTMTYH